MIIIRVLPTSKAVDALVICYEKKKIYKHEGKDYFVTDLKKNGMGWSSRIEAHLTPAWGV
ncbi:hypothetical protein [Vibrio furnissii]|uniref:hypothetical protein n=1 Tax=Vibrio furnissii TaxID=29494 RepID=UPI001EEAFA77|nr:hypothetical protein [Vibrio furnissii]